MSEAFIKYTALLCLLVHEMKSGRDDGPQDGKDSPADMIRDQMDQPWHAMSVEERDLVEKVSAMVYELETIVPVAR